MENSEKVLWDKCFESMSEDEYCSTTLGKLNDIFKEYLIEKATAYDRLMSGGKKNLKEWANIFGAYFAVGKSGVGYVFRDSPPLVENTFMGQCFAIVYPEFIDFSGDWKDSLTLPDGWREK